MCVFVFWATVKNEANSLETFYSFFILKALIVEITAWKTNFLQILSKSFVIFVHTDDPIDDISPIIQSIWITNKKVVFVENLQYFGFQSLDKQNSSFIENVMDYLRGTFSKDHVMSVFFLNNRQNYIHPLIGPNNDPMSLLW